MNQKVKEKQSDFGVSAETVCSLKPVTCGGYQIVPPCTLAKHHTHNTEAVVTICHTQVAAEIVDIVFLAAGERSGLPDVCWADGMKARSTGHAALKAAARKKRGFT